MYYGGFIVIKSFMEIDTLITVTLINLFELGRSQTECLRDSCSGNEAPEKKLQASGSLNGWREANLWQRINLSY
jgi:hypothetical protein